MIGRFSRFFVSSSVLFASTAMTTQAYACGGWLDVACNVGQAIQKGAQDTGHALETATHDTGNAIQKGTSDTGHALETATHDTGNAIQKGTSDTGHALETATHDTGNALEKGTHDTGHALEKAGQDVGHFFGQAFNFKLACSLPGSPPASLKPPYNSVCQGSLDTYKNDLQTCQYAGGASIMAGYGTGAVVGVTTAVGGAVTFGATYAVAKVAFELCQAACRSQANLNQCMADFDKKAAGTGQAVQQVAQKNAEQEALLDRADCIDKAYAAEKRVAMQNIAAACLARGNCNADSKEFNDEYTKKVNESNDAIEATRKSVIDSYKQGHPIASEFGPTLSNPELAYISLKEADTPANENVCHVRKQALHVVARGSFKPDEKISIRWMNDGKIISEIPNVTPNADGSVVADIDLSKQDNGAWTVNFVRPDGSILGSYGFVYLPDEI
jgi:hypothetical protein